MVDVPGSLIIIDQEFSKQQLTFALRAQEQRITLSNIGVHINKTATAQDITQAARLWPRSLTFSGVPATITIDHDLLHSHIQTTIASQLELPANASLSIAPDNSLALVPAHPGEGIDWAILERDILQNMQQISRNNPIVLRVVTAQPEVVDAEVESARTLASQILTEGLRFTAGEQSFSMQPFTVRRLLRFVAQDDLGKPVNKVLGVALDRAGLVEYFTTTLAKEINTPAKNARFELVEGTVKQFVLPEPGRQLDQEASVNAINSQLAQNIREASLTVVPLEPEINELANMQSLGITELLARGESDFTGSPKNRIKNITVGTSRYHGLLIAPGAEFSFNEFLGPVDGDHGFVPELVIKNNVTTPEFGGGLCQVSTTVFRAAVESGMKITARRNHAYAVRYYGPPGFDATIYPPYTDFRFLNNTPRYILIQTKITGTKLSFEFWGTQDGRTVSIEGPTSFQRQANGAVKAVLKQTVVKDNQTLIEDTFYSNYKSPELFPHVLAVNGETPPAATGKSQ